MGRSFFIALLIYILVPGCRTENGNITVAVMLPDNLKYSWASPRVLPAIRMAQEQIQKSGLLRGHTINLLNFSTEDSSGSCSEIEAQIIAVDTKLYNKPDAFIGPGCTYSVASVGRFASHWKLPLITAGGPAYGFDKSDEFKTIFRTGPTTTKLGDFVSYLHAYFNWTSRALMIFHDLKQDDRPHYFLCEGIYILLREENITVEAFPYEDPQTFNYKDIITFIKDNGRSKFRFSSTKIQLATMCMPLNIKTATKQTKTKTHANHCNIMVIFLLHSNQYLLNYALAKSKIQEWIQETCPSDLTVPCKHVQSETQYIHICIMCQFNFLFLPKLTFKKLLSCKVHLEVTTLNSNINLWCYMAVGYILYSICVKFRILQ